MEKCNGGDCLPETDAQQRLANLEELFSHSVDAILIHDLHGNCLDMNRKMRELYDLPLDMVRSATVEGLSEPPVDVARLKSIWRSVAAGETVELEWNARKISNKADFLASVSLTRIQWSGETAILAIIHDIGTQKAIERELVESERKFRQMFEHMLYGFALHEIITDDNGKPIDYRYLDVNPAFGRMTGLAWNEYIGKRVKELLPNVEPYWVDTFGRVALSGESITYSNYAADLARHYEVIAFCPQIGQFAVMCQDVTEQVEQREALKKAVTELEGAIGDLQALNENLEGIVTDRTAALQTANRALEAKMTELKQAQEELLRSEKLASIGELVAGVAHEINTPLGVGVTAASFLESSINEIMKSNQGLAADPAFRKMGAKWADTSRIILANLDRAARLVKSFKQVSVDRTSDPLRVIMLREYTEEMLLSLNPMVKRSGSLVENRIPETIKLTTYPGALSQVLINLVTNAQLHAFTQERPGIMTLLAEQENGKVSITFRDNGKGIPPAIRPRIFDPFFTTRKDKGGSGLGLFIVQNLVTNRLNGTITCKAVPEGGTEFILLLPAEIQSKEEE